MLKKSGIIALFGALVLSTAALAAFDCRFTTNQRCQHCRATHASPGCGLDCIRAGTSP